MSYRNDGWLPKYIDAAPVTNGATITGDPLLLNAAAGVSIQVICTGGAAGTLNVDASNQDGRPSVYATPTSQAITANGTAYFTYALADPVTSFARMRCRFVATAGGNVTVAVNIRRTVP